MADTSMANINILRDRLAEVKQGFKQQQDWYLRLPLETRRDLRRPSPVDRFRCAAIFQHQPSTRGPYGYYAESIEDLEREDNRNEPSAEICPFTDFYYADIENAQEALDDGKYDEAALSIGAAFEQLMEVHLMLMRMSRRPKTYLEPQDKWRTLWAWNDACYWVQKGASVEDAIDRALRMDRGGVWNDDSKKDNGPRQYFSWNPLGLGFPAKPIYPTNLSQVNDIPRPTFRPTMKEWKTIFADYENAWSTLSPHSANFPHPVTIMQDITPEPAYTHTQPPSITIKVFFLRGAGFTTLLIRNRYVFEAKTAIQMEKPLFGLAESPEAIKELEKYLSKVELKRRHPDQLNKRTGMPGEVDEEIAERKGNRGVFLAVRELVEMLREPGVHFKHPMDLDSRWKWGDC